MLSTLAVLEYQPIKTSNTPYEVSVAASNNNNIHHDFVTCMACMGDYPLESDVYSTLSVCIDNR